MPPETTEPDTGRTLLNLYSGLAYAAGKIQTPSSLSRGEISRSKQALILKYPDIVTEGSGISLPSQLASLWPVGRATGLTGCAVDLIE